MKNWWMAMAVVLALACGSAEAARLGGGKSLGRQSANVTQREAVPAAPGQNVSRSAATAPQPGAPTPPVTQPRPWGSMLGGLAAGLGLAWLAHSLGFGEVFGQLLVVMLFVMLGMIALGWFVRLRQRPVVPGSYAFQGAQGASGPAARAPYRPENVGNDASARPWERNSMSFDVSRTAPVPPGSIGSALAGSQSWGVPAGFDSEGFLRSAKTNFVTLQAAWDRADISSLRAMMTDEMLAEIRAQLAEREKHTGGQQNRTDVIMLEARLLGIEDLGDDYMASVEYSGMIREDPSAGPSPFREVWNMTKPKNGANGWLVAGVQALQ